MKAFPYWPISLELKWKQILQQDPSLARFQNHPWRILHEWRMLYVTQREFEFFRRAEKWETGKYAFYACRFCRMEWLWDADFYSYLFERTHIARCRAYREYVEDCRLRAVLEPDGQGNYRFKKQKRKKQIGPLHLDVEQILHRKESMIEFSGGPECYESEIIHDLIENWVDLPYGGLP